MEKVDLIVGLVNEIDFTQVMHLSRPVHTVRCTTAFFNIIKWNVWVTMRVFA